MKRNIKTKYRIESTGFYKIIGHQNSKGYWTENSKEVVPKSEIIDNFLEVSNLLKKHGLTIEDVLKAQKNEKTDNP